MSRKMEGASMMRVDRKLKRAIASREPGAKGKKASDADVARLAAESQHESLRWLTTITGDALR